METRLNINAIEDGSIPLSKLEEVPSGEGYDDTEIREELAELSSKTLILGPHIGNDTAEHRANISKAIVSNACYGRVTVDVNSGTYISIGKHNETYYVDVITHFAHGHLFSPKLERYQVRPDGIWRIEYSIPIDGILTLYNLATQSEIDALFEGSSNGGSSTSY